MWTDRQSDYYYSLVLTFSCGTLITGVFCFKRMVCQWEVHLPLVVWRGSHLWSVCQGKMHHPRRRILVDRGLYKPIRISCHLLVQHCKQIQKFIWLLQTLNHSKAHTKLVKLSRRTHPIFQRTIINECYVWIWLDCWIEIRGFGSCTYLFAEATPSSDNFPNFSNKTTYQKDLNNHIFLVLVTSLNGFQFTWLNNSSVCLFSG